MACHPSVTNRLPLGSWNELDAIPVNKSCRAIKLLDIRAFELKSDVHEVFDRVWNALIHVDAEVGRISIGSPQEGRHQMQGTIRELS